MSTPLGPSPAQLASDIQVLAYVNVLALALLTYDTILTFDDEIRLVWKKKINPGAMLYYLTRYAGLLNLFLNVLFGFLPLNPNDARLCLTINTILNVCFIFGFIGTHGLLTARAYALCGSKIIILFVLLALFVGGLIPILIDVSFQASSYMKRNDSSWYIVSDAQIILIIISDTVVFLITAYQAFGSWNARKSLRLTQTSPNLVRTLFRQGVLRYCFVLVVTVAEAIVERKARPSIQSVLGPFQQTLSIIILCRFSLDLRLKIAGLHSFSSSQTASGTGTGSGTRTRTHISWSQMQTDPDTTYGHIDSISVGFGNTNTRSKNSGQPIQRAVRYIHEELINEFGESSSDLTMVDPSRPSNVGSDELENGNERAPMLNVDFGEFRWPGNRGDQLFVFPAIELNEMRPTPPTRNESPEA